MAQKFWPSYNKAIRDKLRTQINNRATADAIDVKEVVTAMSLEDWKRYKASGIYVLPGRWRSSPEAEEITGGFLGRLSYDAACNVRAYTEGKQLDRLGELVSVVVDAVEADVLLGGQAGVEYAYISGTTGPRKGIGGPNEQAIMDVVEITVQVARDGP